MNISKNLKILIYIGLYALLLTPFIVDSSLFFPYITGKAFYFRIITETVFFLWIILALLDREYRPRKNPLLYILGLFLISLFFSNIFGVDKINSFWSNFERMEGYVTMVHLFGLFLVMGSVFKTQENWFWFFSSSVFMSLVMGITAINQVFENGLNYRVDTTLGNSTYLGIYMLINAFLSIWLFSKTEINRAKISLYSLIFLLQSIVIFQTGTRGSILGLIGGVFLIIILSIIFSKHNENVRKVSSLVLLVFFFLVGSLFLFKESSFVKNFQGFNRITNISISEGTAQARLINWGIAWEGVKERPFLGWGQSNYNIVFDKYYDPKMFGQESWFDRTHNIIFDWLIAGGFVGLLLYFGIILLAIYSIWFKSNFTTFEKSILTGLFAGYFVHNLFVFDNIVSYILFFFVLAYIHSQTSQEIKIFQKSLSTNVSYVLVSVSLILIPYTIYAVNMNPMSVSKNLIKAIQITGTNQKGQTTFIYENGLADNMKIFKEIIDKKTFGNPEVRARLLATALSISLLKGAPEKDKQEFIQFAVDEMKQQIIENPDDPKYLYILGSAMINLGENDLAIEYLKKAIDLSPRRQIFYFLLSQAYLQDGQKEQAIEAAKTAYEMEPSLYLSWVNYIRLISAADNEFFTSAIDEKIKSGQGEWVERLILENINKSPENIQNYVSLASLYFQINRVDESLKILEDVKEMFPGSEKQIDELRKQIESGSISQEN